jgi:hypothetical protein
VPIFARARQTALVSPSTAPVHRGEKSAGRDTFAWICARDVDASAVLLQSLEHGPASRDQFANGEQCDC